MQLPTLLEKVAALMRVDTGSALKTPTDLYKAFDKILKNETLLDSIDVKCQCNIIELVLKVVKKCSPALITETEADDVLKKRQSKILQSGRLQIGNISEEILGAPPRNIELTLKAEATTYSILKTLDMDITRPENMETILG